jgi:hypothetical protein
MPPKSNRQTPCFSIQELYGCNSSFLGLRGILFSSIRNRKGLNPKRRLEQRAFMHWWQLTFGSTNLQENHGKSKDLEVKKTILSTPSGWITSLRHIGRAYRWLPSPHCWWTVNPPAAVGGICSRLPLGLGVVELGMGITMKDLWRFLGH